MAVEKLEEKVDTLEKELLTHEVQCEERWKTNFTRLGEIEEAIARIENRLVTIGGGVILFLAGLVVTILFRQ